MFTSRSLDEVFGSPFACGFLSVPPLGTLAHGGLLLLPNPILRSGGERRHANLNNLQDIAEATCYKATEEIAQPVFESGWKCPIRNSL